MKLCYFKINYKIILSTETHWNKDDDTSKYSEPAKHSKENNTHRFKWTVVVYP